MTSSELGVEYLLDTNILIYMTKGDDVALQFVERQSGIPGISVITYMEALMGVTGPEEQMVLDSTVESLTMVPLSEHIARRCANILRMRDKRSIRDPYFADVVIANTALALGVPLITNNPKDFTRFPGLRVLTPRLKGGS